MRFHNVKLIRAFQGLVIFAWLLTFFDLAFSQERTTGASPEPGFTVVVLPDTQYYSNESRGGSRKMFTAQTKWVAKNKKKEDIRAVIGLGDIVNNYSGDVEPEWRNADSAFRILDKSGVPYLPLIGNHDYDRLEGWTGRTAKGYNRHFGPARFAGRSWYGGGFPAGSNENHYITFTAGAKSYLVIALEFYPRTTALEWAQRVVDANPDKEVIVATHIYLGDRGQRIVRPAGDGLPPESNDAEGMWAKFVKVNKNVFLVLCGHIAPLEGSAVMGRRSDVGDHGNLVHQLHSDYQGIPNGGNGYMRIMKFRPSKGLIEVKTYSPYLKTYLTDDSNQFTLEYAGTAKNELRQQVTDQLRNRIEILSPSLSPGQHLRISQTRFSGPGVIRGGSEPPLGNWFVEFPQFTFKLRVVELERVPGVGPVELE